MTGTGASLVLLRWLVHFDNAVWIVGTEQTFALDNLDEQPFARGNGARRSTDIRMGRVQMFHVVLRESEAERSIIL